MNHTTSAGGVVINPDGYVLVVNQDGVVWSLPKGKLEAGEDARTAAAREIREESGLTELQFIQELGTYQRYKINQEGNGEDPRTLKTITIFLYTTPQHTLQPLDPHNPEARWVAPEKVAAMLSHPKDQAFYQSHLATLQNFIQNS